EVARVNRQRLWIVSGFLLGVLASRPVPSADVELTDVCVRLGDLPLPRAARLQIVEAPPDGPCRARIELAASASWRDLYMFFRDLPLRETSSSWSVGSLELTSRGKARSRVAWQVRLYRDGWRYEVYGTQAREATVTIQAGSAYPRGRMGLPAIDETLRSILPSGGEVESELWEAPHYMRVVSFLEGSVRPSAESLVQRLQDQDWQIRKIVLKFRDRPPWVEGVPPSETADLLRETPEEAGVIEARRGTQELGFSLVAAEGRVFIVVTLDGRWPE
ncbi:MAG: hypothetical protein RMK16_10490, partial [Acidobacteriota bacterium]|nr:hypothetical protein [Acidobacteriota bacterium]